MVAYTKPQHRRKEESEQLRGYFRHLKQSFITFELFLMKDSGILNLYSTELASSTESILLPNANEIMPSEARDLKLKTINSGKYFSFAVILLYHFAIFFKLCLVYEKFS